MKGLLTYIVLLVAFTGFSQEKDNSLPRGNKEFNNNKYADAEASYRIAQSKAPAKATASYNLGNAIYRQKFAGEALYAYSKAIENAKTKKEKHMAYHNMGNALMKEKNYQAAVEAYKNALRNNPLDDETRYNFALAKKMLKDNPPPPPPPDDKKDDKKDKDKNKDQKPNDPKDDKDKGGDDNKDKKEQDKGKPEDKGNDEKDQKDKGDGKDKNDDGQGDKNPQPQQASPSKQRMENLLDAMNNEEKKVQDKINKTKAKASPKRQEKDW